MFEVRAYVPSLEQAQDYLAKMRASQLSEYVFQDYILNQAESWNLGCVKAPGLNRSKEIPYYNMGSLSIVQPRELSR